MPKKRPPKRPSRVPPGYAASRLGALDVKQGTTLDLGLGNAVLHLRPNSGRPLDRRYVIGEPRGIFPKTKPYLDQAFADYHFKEAVAESHRLYYDVYSKWCQLNILGGVLRSKNKTAAAAAVARKMAELGEKLEVLMDDIVWLVGGLLGRYDEGNNARARARALELLSSAAARAAKSRKGRQKRDLRSSRVPAGRTAFARGKSRSKKPRDLKSRPVT